MLERFPAVGIDRLNAAALAAIVHDDEDAADHLLWLFADELKASRVPVGGVVRQPGSGRFLRRFVDLASGDSWPVATAPRDPAGHRGLDEMVFPEVIRRIKGCIEGPAALVLVAGYGAREVAGSGLADAFGTPAAFGLPILTAVWRQDVAAWMRFTGGVGTLLACRLPVVRSWWEETASRRRRALDRQRHFQEETGRGERVVSLRPVYR